MKKFEDSNLNRRVDANVTVSKGQLLTESSIYDFGIQLRSIDKDFTDFKSAFEFLENYILETEGDGCLDNFRSASTVSDLDNYQKIVDAGCCGSLDLLVTVSGSPVLIGCNYGH